MLESIKNRWKFSALFVLGFHLFLLLNTQFTAWPEMIAWPYLMLKGWLPYEGIAIVHTPLMLVDLSIFNWIFGLSVKNLQIYTYLLILLIDIVLFIIVKELWNKRTALIAIFTFSVWQIFFQGNGLWFDLYMGALVLLSFYSVKKKDWFWAGVFWGLAFLSKQTAFWFLGPIGLSLLGKGFFENTKKFTVGVLSTIVPALFIVRYFGILPDFFYWAFEFGITELPRSVGQIFFPSLRQILIALFPFSIFIPLLIRKPKNIDLALWAFAGMLGAYPRFEYFHFQPALPYLAIATAIIHVSLKRKDMAKNLFLTLYISVSIFLVFNVLGRSWGLGTRFYDEGVERVAETLRGEVETDERIYVINYWDSLYAFTNTLPATDTLVPHLPWYIEVEGVQDGIVSDLKENSPEVVVVGEYSETGLSSYKPAKIDKYIDENYSIVNTVEGVNILKKK